MSAEDVAKWMVAEVERGTILDQTVAAYHIQQNFGEEWVHTNSRGNLAISPLVLELFKKIGGSEIVWERGSRAWRKREPHDMPGRRQP